MAHNRAPSLALFEIEVSWVSLVVRNAAASATASTRNTATVAVSTDWVLAALPCMLLQLDDACMHHENAALAAQHLRSLLSSASKTRKQVRPALAPTLRARVQQHGSRDRIA
jgi:hypothetical protein